MMHGLVLQDIRPWALGHGQPWLSSGFLDGHRYHIKQLVRVTRPD